MKLKHDTSRYRRYKRERIKVGGKMGKGERREKLEKWEEPRNTYNMEAQRRFEFF